MKRLLITLLATAFAVSCFAQTTEAKTTETKTTETKEEKTPTVTVSSDGKDVRMILHEVFTQAKKSYVLDPSVRFILFLSLSDMEFEEALALICKTAGLKYELQNGIFFVNKPKTAPANPAVVTPVQVPVVTKPLGKLPQSVLKKTLSVKFEKVEIRQLFKDIAGQSEVMIEVNPKVPGYKLDVTLNEVTLKYALDTVCKAANLSYKFTDSLSIEIYPNEEINRVSLAPDTAVKSGG